MAQFIVMGVGALVNTLAFSGGNALFSMASEQETKDSDSARQKFQEDLAAWNQRKIARDEFLAKRLQEAADSAVSDTQTLDSLRVYQQFFGPNNDIPIDQNADPSPSLKNYMPEPSDNTKQAEYFVIAAGMLVTTYIAYKIGHK